MLPPTPAPLRQARQRRDPAIRSYPGPYRAWLTICNDPDNTRIGDWQQVHDLIWKELGLPLADSLFIRSYNLQLPDQVDLHRHPHILDAHAHDTIHTWGDFIFAGARAFHRPDAEEHLAILRERGFAPRVWVDHSMFPGNLLHRHQYGGIPFFRDFSGHDYPNPFYTLDLIHQAGVRYAWNGALTTIIGQDRPISLWRQHFLRSKTLWQAAKGYLLHRFGASFGLGEGFREQYVGNGAYRAMGFPDGNQLYSFVRFGDPPQADIHGLGELLAAATLDRLASTGGTMIIYTHLGKRRPAAMGDARHIPLHTEAALRDLHRRYQRSEIMISSVSRLLDYLILRDHIQIDRAQRVIRFSADGIAFDRVGQQELSGHAFTFMGLGKAPFRVMAGDDEVVASTESHADGSFTKRFA
ncbi:MAG: hypothetical protein IPM46_05455 [Flavobacteriales bacterium]|nr:hypothetical protein [Flavobacteriales bacterium]